MRIDREHAILMSTGRVRVSFVSCLSSSGVCSSPINPTSKSKSLSVAEAAASLLNKTFTRQNFVTSEFYFQPLGLERREKKEEKLCTFRVCIFLLEFFQREKYCFETEVPISNIETTKNWLERRQK